MSRCYKEEVENQIDNLRDQLFLLKPRVTSLAEINARVEDQCIAHAKRTRHPELRDQTMRKVLQEEQANLMPLREPFDGFVAKAVRDTSGGTRSFMTRGIVCRCWRRSEAPCVMALFKDWDLPPGLVRVRARLKSHADGDR